MDLVAVLQLSGASTMIRGEIMVFANNLSLSTRVLTTSGWLLFGWLSITGCQQRPLPSKATGAAQAGAAAKGTMAGKAKTTAGASTEEDASAAMPNAGSSAKSGTKTNTSNAAGAAAPAAESGQSRASAGGAAPAAAAPAAANPKAIPACEGKVDEQVCDETMLYHCVDGAYEGRPQSCMTAAQCQAGLTTGQCGECDPGTFQCTDIELQRCDDTGAWVLELECASAKLCKADTGICDMQVCGEGEYQCMGDQLQTCNADFTDWIAEGAPCEPGLCSKEAMGCLECLPSTAPTCEDERTVMTCTDQGMEAPQPCAAATPFCAEGACVQCTTDADCPAAMNDCGTMACTAGMCAAGSPKPRGTACTSNGGQMCDYLGACVVCVTDLDCNDSTKRCYLQSRCVPKDAVTATPLFSTWSVTVSPGFRANVTTNPSGLTVEGARGGALEASQTIDATYLLGVTGYSADGLFSQVASGDGSRVTLNYAPSDPMMCPTTPCQNVQVILTAEKVD
jgi:hypothetical protein